MAAPDHLMKQHLAISAIGNDRTGMVHDLARVVADCGGNIAESRMTALGAEFAMLLLVTGNWHTVARLETELKRLADTSGLAINVRRTEQRGSALTCCRTRSTSCVSIRPALCRACRVSFRLAASISPS